MTKDLEDLPDLDPKDKQYPVCGIGELKIKSNSDKIKIHILGIQFGTDLIYVKQYNGGGPIHYTKTNITQVWDIDEYKTLQKFFK